MSWFWWRRLRRRVAFRDFAPLPPSRSRSRRRRPSLRRGRARLVAAGLGLFPRLDVAARQRRDRRLDEGPLVRELPAARVRLVADGHPLPLVVDRNFQNVDERLLHVPPVTAVESQAGDEFTSMSHGLSSASTMKS